MIPVYQRAFQFAKWKRLPEGYPRIMGELSIEANTFIP